jgi:hypothetical protein
VGLLYVKRTTRRVVLLHINCRGTTTNVVAGGYKLHKTG